MPVIAFGGFALFAAVVFAIGIVATTIAKPSSTSISNNNLLSDIVDAKKNFDQRLKMLMLLGTVMISATIISKLEKKKQQEEALNNISSAGAASASTAAAMNGVQNIVTQVQSEKAQVSETTALNPSKDGYVETFPAAEEEGPKIYDTPITEQQGPGVLVFPRAEQEPTILVFPDDNPVKPYVESFPAERPKELGDSILWMGSNHVEVPKSVDRVVKKLSPEAKKGYEKAIKALENGDTRGLNEHPLSGNRSGQWAVDIKGMGRGRGAGRIIYEKNSDGSIKIVEVLTKHDY